VRQSTEEVNREREEFELADAIIRKQSREYERQREDEAQAQVAEWRRVTGIRTGDGDEPGMQIRKLISAHARLGRKLPIKIVSLRRDELRRDLTLLEMWQCLQPTDRDLDAGWEIPEVGARVSEVLPMFEEPKTETAEEARRRQLDDWRNWNPEA
jgi:hypothetical protein